MQWLQVWVLKLSKEDCRNSWSMFIFFPLPFWIQSIVRLEFWREQELFQSHGNSKWYPPLLGAILVLVLIVSLCACADEHSGDDLRQILRLTRVLSIALASVSLTGNFLDFQFHPSTQRDEQATCQNSLCCWNCGTNQGSHWTSLCFLNFTDFSFYAWHWTVGNHHGRYTVHSSPGRRANLLPTEPHSPEVDGPLLVLNSLSSVSIWSVIK